MIPIITQVKMLGLLLFKWDHEQGRLTQQSHVTLGHWLLHVLMCIHPIIQSSIACHWPAQPSPKVCLPRRPLQWLRNLWPAERDIQHRGTALYMHEEILEIKWENKRKWKYGRLRAVSGEEGIGEMDKVRWSELTQKLSLRQAVIKVKGSGLDKVLS